MAVRIGSAKGSYGNTSAGDQSGGKEVSRENWYAHSKGWVLLRAKDAAARERIALAMERACDNNDIGYHQGTRDTLYVNVKPAGFDPAKTTRKVNTDCSALVRVCVNFAGIKAGNFTTSSEVSVLMGTGAFVKYTDDAHCKSSKQLLRGDILVTKTKGHTVVVLDDGARAVATPSEARPADANPADSSVALPELPPKAKVSGASNAKAEKEFGQVADVAVAASAGKLVEITGNTVNLRADPSTLHDPVGIAKRGQRFELLCEANGFVPVLVGGAVRYVSKKYVTAVATSTKA